MIYIGIDPAVSKETAVCVIKPTVVEFHLFDSHDPQYIYKRLDIPESTPITLTIEGQEVYRGSKVKPQTLIDLAQRAGYFEGLLCSGLNVVKVYRPLPKQWKGQVPADLYRRRILKKYPTVAKALSGYNKQHQEDLAHAYGLAIWKKPHQ